jgi:endonuclease-3
MDVVPEDEWIWFGHAMIWHGRDTCIARAPKCSACVLQDFCPKRGVPQIGGPGAGRTGRTRAPRRPGRG